MCPPPPFLHSLDVDYFPCVVWQWMPSRASRPCRPSSSRSTHHCCSKAPAACCRQLPLSIAARAALSLQSPTIRPSAPVSSRRHRQRSHMHLVAHSWSLGRCDGRHTPQPTPGDTPRFGALLSLYIDTASAQWDISSGIIWDNTCTICAGGDNLG